MIYFFRNILYMNFSFCFESLGFHPHAHREFSPLLFRIYLQGTIPSSNIFPKISALSQWVCWRQTTVVHTLLFQGFHAVLRMYIGSLKEELQDTHPTPPLPSSHSLFLARLLSRLLVIHPVPNPSTSKLHLAFFTTLFSVFNIWQYFPWKDLVSSCH